MRAQIATNTCFFTCALIRLENIPGMTKMNGMQNRMIRMQFLCNFTQLDGVLEQLLSSACFVCCPRAQLQSLHCIHAHKVLSTLPFMHAARSVSCARNINLRILVSHARKLFYLLNCAAGPCARSYNGQILSETRAQRLSLRHFLAVFNIFILG